MALYLDLTLMEPLLIEFQIELFFICFEFVTFFMMQLLPTDPVF